MPNSKATQQEQSLLVLSALDEHVDVVFDSAPIMMHMIDPDGRFYKANRRWTDTLGYKREDVLGKKSVDFLTPESRERAIKDTLPLFWRVGSARSVGYGFVRRDGGVQDVQMDAELVTVPGGNRFTFAALRSPDDRRQWEQSSTTLKTLSQLNDIKRRLGRVQGVMPEDSRGLDIGEVLGQTLGPLLEVLQDISASLSSAKGDQEEWLNAALEQQELLLIARSVDRTLADLAETIADSHAGRVEALERFPGDRSECGVSEPNAS